MPSIRRAKMPSVHFYLVSRRNPRRAKRSTKVMLSKSSSWKELRCCLQFSFGTTQDLELMDSEGYVVDFDHSSLLEKYFVRQL